MDDVEKVRGGVRELNVRVDRLGPDPEPVVDEDDIRSRDAEQGTDAVVRVEQEVHSVRDNDTRVPGGASYSPSRTRVDSLTDVPVLGWRDVLTDEINDTETWARGPSVEEVYGRPERRREKPVWWGG